jgi:phosphoribosylformylglycinamidine synthase II
VGVYRIEVGARRSARGQSADLHLMSLLQEAGLAGVASAWSSRLFFVAGSLDRTQAAQIAETLLVDPVTERAEVLGEGDHVPEVERGQTAIEAHPRPGVMDPVAESTLAELRAEGWAIESVRTGRRYIIRGPVSSQAVLGTARRVLANDCIEEVALGTVGIRAAPQPPVFEPKLRRIMLGGLDDAALEHLSRSAHLFLSLAELRAIQGHYRALGREPTDLELETLAQTWSEHCVHKTLKAAIVYRGTPMPSPDGVGADAAVAGSEKALRYGNLLRDTIARATEELIAAGDGPQCLSVFKDNAGVMAFDEDYGVAFKVETHNHPSAIEPYGGAATGIGGVIRDVIGCGLGAKPIASTDVFCVAPADWPQNRLPKGVLHPRRVLRGVVRGVADYGNRMGIPTVNGTVYFDPRYLGNPLVFCGSVGLIPRRMVQKGAQPGDLVVVIGGRTGRDGIHGATFSSAELTDTHADEFSHAVQIGNAITEKRFLDAILQARDDEPGCLYTAITDCGAGGLSSAVGEMAEDIGAVVELDRVPLKYSGLRYDEIWISEAQERMVVAVPPGRLDRFLRIMQDEEVEATVIGRFGTEQPGAPRLVLRYRQQVVGDLDLAFLHDGLPRPERVAEWSSPAAARARAAAAEAGDETGGLASALRRLPDELARPNVSSKEWIIRQYDHEVQGGSVVKPLVGPGHGPADAAVLRPRLDSYRGVALGCGLAPHLSDSDPYWMAAASIDEALRNVVSVGGNPDRTALLDNFCWGRSDDPRQLGALVRACQACYDVAKANRTPFISGKDSLNNEFALDEADVEPLLETLRQRAAADGVEAERLRALLPGLESRVRTRRRLAIPPTLLISAVSVVDDVRRCVTPDLKQAGHDVLLIGGVPQTDFSLAAAAKIHRTVAELIRKRLVAACHDVADGGWLVALAEMAIAGDRGVDLHGDPRASVAPLAECCAGYVAEVIDCTAATGALEQRGATWAKVGRVRADKALAYCGTTVEVADLRAAWSGRQR